MRKINTMAELQARAIQMKNSFFGEGEMRFFDSIVYNDVHQLSENEYLFITSEKFWEEGYERKFTIRIFNYTTGKIDTVGEFQQYRTKKTALAEINKIINSVYIEQNIPDFRREEN
jgi:hypothetical protein